ncbi:hypothetical protein J2W71_000357 [Pseudomonas sp. 3400]|nr:hypothetical protein [Pseudomonas sp. 3400]MDR7010458.1 hypothetical protein [Pseudomonas alcaliphila]
MSVSRRFWALFSCLFFVATFILLGAWRAEQPIHLRAQIASDRVVPNAPILVVLYAGDRYLAASLEAIRLSSTGISYSGVDTDYLIRSQRVVAELNACHEDNYYLANGLLTWGGAVQEGNHVLKAAMACRFWDYVPAFFYGVNLAFFQRQYSEASVVMVLAAERSQENSATLRRLAISLRAEGFADETLALSYLTQQRDSTKEPSLREMLDKRVVRLQGLIDLRAAQRRYELASGPLSDLQQLVSSGLLTELPQDPLNLGYELRDGLVEMKKLKIAGMESQP